MREGAQKSTARLRKSAQLFLQRAKCFKKYFSTFHPVVPRPHLEQLCKGALQAPDPSKAPCRRHRPRSRLAEPRQGCGPPHRRSSRRESATRPARHSSLQHMSRSKRRIRKSGWPCGGGGEGERRSRSEASPRPAASRQLPVQPRERWAQVNTPCSHFRRHPRRQGAKKTQGTGGAGRGLGGRLRSKG